MRPSFATSNKGPTQGQCAGMRTGGVLPIIGIILINHKVIKPAFMFKGYLRTCGQIPNPLIAHDRVGPHNIPSGGIQIRTARGAPKFPPNRKRTTNARHSYALFDLAKRRQEGAVALVIIKGLIV